MFDLDALLHPFAERVEDAKKEIVDSIREVVSELENLQAEEISETAFSRTVATDAIVGNDTVLSLEPRPGVVWKVYGIAVWVDDAVTNRNIAVWLGGVGQRPVVSITSNAANGGVGGSSWNALPVTLPIVIRIAAGIATGARVVLHVYGMELEDKASVAARQT